LMQASPLGRRPHPGLRALGALPVRQVVLPHALPQGHADAEGGAGDDLRGQGVIEKMKRMVSSTRATTLRSHSATAAALGPTAPSNAC
jgi:hypothetical protein